jgi:integrase
MARTDGLYRRGDYWYFKYKPADGVWCERATRSRNYQDAKRIRTQFLSDLQEGKLPNERARWTLQQAVTQWLTDRKHRVAPGSYASEVSISRNLIHVLGAESRLDKLADVQVIRRYETKRREAGISSKTVNNEILVFAGLLREAKLWRRISADYKRLKVEKSDVPDALSRDEAYRLLQVAYTASENAVAPYAAVLAYATGMRSREIKQLQIGAIRLDGPNPQLQVRRATTKTNKGARFVALDTMACWAIRRLLDRAKRLGASTNEHYLLPTLRDKHTRATDPLHGGTGWDAEHPQSSFDAEWDDVREKAKIKHRRFHDLRHSYVTRCAEAGIPLPVVQAQVGHVGIAMVEHYTHVSQGAVHRAAQQLERDSSDLLKRLGLQQPQEQERTSEETNATGISSEADEASAQPLSQDHGGAEISELTASLQEPKPSKVN